MLRILLPVESNWGTGMQYVCFNDECSYFVKGWEHTKKTMNKPASYRHHYHPETGRKGPLAVWSRAALRDLIVPEDRED